MKHIVILPLYDSIEHIEKRYYAISEVAQLFQVSTSLIRFWEKEFKSLRPEKNKQGARRYTHTDIAQLRLIYHLVKEKGYTLQGAREELSNNNNKLTNNVELIHALKDVRSFLVALQEKLA